MSDKEELEQQGKKYSRLNNIITQSGWQDVLEIIHEEYENALTKIKEANSIDAVREGRGALKAIEAIVNKINSEYAFAEEAKKQYIKKYISIDKNAI